MFLPIQIGWINSPYNVNLFLLYTGCLSQRERYIEVSLDQNDTFDIERTLLILKEHNLRVNGILISR